MSIIQKLIRWGVALVAAAVVYYIVLRLVPMAESGVSAISPTVLVLNTVLLSTAAGVIVAGFLVPREHIARARKYLFILGMLVPIARAVWDFAHTGGMNHDYLAMLGGAFAGGMIGLFILILPKPQRQVQPRRFT